MAINTYRQKSENLEPLVGENLGFGWFCQWNGFFEQCPGIYSQAPKLPWIKSYSPYLKKIQVERDFVSLWGVGFQSTCFEATTNCNNELLGNTTKMYCENRHFSNAMCVTQTIFATYRIGWVMGHYVLAFWSLGAWNGNVESPSLNSSNLSSLLSQSRQPHFLPGQKMVRAIFCVFI